MATKLCFVLIFTTGLLAGRGVTSSSTTRHKRSDDAMPVEAVVENLTREVASLNAEVTALKTKTATLERSVAFYAWHEANPLQTGPLATLILDHVITNIGNAYDRSTGIFTAPTSGLYDFQASFMPYAQTTKKVYAGIFVDGQQVAEGVADSQHGFWDQTTIRAVVHVISGQKVRVRNVLSSLADYYSSGSQPYTTFSGFLLKAD